MNVLVVDDNDRIAEMIGEYLKLRGISTSRLNSGKNVFEIQKDFDFIILDLAMNDAGGISVLEEFSKNKVPCSKIIVLTAAYLSESEISKIEKFGIRVLLEKPVDLKILMSFLMEDKKLMVGEKSTKKDVT